MKKETDEMALMKCPDCGKKVSPRAVACPECGCTREYFEKLEQVEHVAGGVASHIGSKTVEAHMRDTNYEVPEFCEKRLILSKERVIEQLNEKYSKTYIIFNDCQIKFDAKYFILKELEKIANHAQEIFQQEIEKLDNSDSDVCKVIENHFNGYTENLTSDIKKLEKLLEFSICEELVAEITNNIQSAWSKLGDLELDLEEISQGKIIVKSERERRKKERGKCTGYGHSVAEAIKEGATEGVKNAVSGVAQIGVNIVGNVVLSVAAIIRRNKEIKKFFDAIERNMNVISGGIFGECIEVINDYYPELRFDSEYYDTEAEKNIRKQFLESSVERENKAIELLLRNPYNPLNGFMIRYDYILNHKDLWNQNTENVFGLMEKQFEWKARYERLYSEVGQKAADILERDAEDQISDESVIDDYKEILHILECMTRVEMDDKLKKSYTEAQDIYKSLSEKQKYVDLIKDIYKLNVEQILEKGAIYCQRNEFSKAQRIYTRGLKNNPTAKLIMEYFFQAKNKEKMLGILEQYVDRKSSITPQTYEDVMRVLARIRNQEGKTLLVYASELHRIKVMGELINFDADVSLLDQSKDAANTRVICKSCGEELEGNVKFCKYCGKKI